ncbi:nicotinamide riboside transporter PnuC [Acinetobacter sp. YH16032]|uniref:nicotinamide riboside transporter PnuC n=1 Tax=Acinetobacter sp. YH16032 TaxID=2601181 RepID=UPI0015D19C39|nr:nicotinamide riboside transporter PnuC [Acinetobacter sp. YH16032]
MSLLEIISVLMSVLGVTLTIRRNIWCWPVNLVAYGLYAKLFYDYQLYGETILQCVFIGLGVYGWWIWKAQFKQQEQLAINRIQGLRIIKHVFFTMLAGFIFGLGLDYFTDASIPYLDAQLASLSLLITYWTSKRYLEIWPAWIAVDIIYVMMFMYKDLYLTAGLYGAFIVLALLGYLQWKKKYQVQQQTVYSL